MPLNIIRADITTIDCDAIVCPTNRRLLPGNGLDRTVHMKAGREFSRACLRLDECPEGEAVYTDGYNLKAKYVIQTVGPHWKGGENGEEEILRRSYESCLKIVDKLDIQSVAFPLVAAGYYDVPKELALRVASSVLRDYLEKREEDILIYLVVFDRKAFQISTELFDDVKQYIDDNYFDEEKYRVRSMKYSQLGENALFEGHIPGVRREDYYEKTVASIPLDEALKAVDEGFSDMLRRKIREKGMTEVECYRKANVDRRLFSKIMSNADYSPSKGTALAFAVALELPLPELVEMVGKAGYSFTSSNKRDIVVKYFVDRGDYDIFKINETLFAFDLVPIGYKK